MDKEHEAYMAAGRVLIWTGVLDTAQRSGIERWVVDVRAEVERAESDLLALGYLVTANGLVVSAPLALA